MTSICREIFKAIHEGKWLSIEYKNKDGRITKYWIGIKSLNLRDRSMVVDGLHLGQLKVQELKIFVDSILNAKIVEGSYCEINRGLVEDIKRNPAKYAGLFDQIPNLIYLNYISIKHIKRLSEPKYKELLRIIYMDADDPERVPKFNQYLSEPDNVRLLQRVFPIIATTCISARRIGEPGVYFDMVIMDEASQCNTAVSLVPILRGENLMLVGDPQQLQPVIVLDSADHQTLRKKYAIAQEYDYIDNSVYKTFLACDPVSDEVLLRHHYRCHPKIIGFNNKKYYNGKLVVDSDVSSKTPLMFVDVQESEAAVKNTSPGEAEQIIRFVCENPGKNVGIITPFANQRILIRDELSKIGRSDIACGTVHAFQGDEKDVITISRIS